MIFPNCTGGCRRLVNAGRNLCICRCRLWWRLASWKYYKQNSKSCNFMEATLKSICKTKEFMLQENFQCSQVTARPVGIWWGLLQIMKRLNTYMCLVMEAAKISTTGENASSETHYAYSTGLLGSVTLRVGLLNLLEPHYLARLFHLWAAAEESEITQISAGYPGPAGRQGCVSALWGWGCSQRASPSLLALGEGRE